MVASEAAPLVKTGGLADVVGALPRALRELGHDVAIVLPRYGSISLDGAVRRWDDLAVHLGRHAFSCSLWEKQVSGTRVFLVDCPYLFDRTGGIYGHGDDHLRFAVFCHGALGVLRHLFNANVLHLHDWQAALCGAYLRTRYELDPLFAPVKLVYTIHNLDYQGRFGNWAIGELNLDARLMQPNCMEFYGDVSLMKGGIYFADAVTTVSPRYAQEIQTPEFGSGLDGFLRAHAHKLTGILNGCDYSEWDPRHDPHLARAYSPEDLTGKLDCKLDLLFSLGLHEENMERPVLGMVTRFAHQKGLDLVMPIAADLLEHDGVCLAIVGSGEPRYEDFVRQLAGSYPGRVSGYIGFNNALAHKVEAGSDLFLMPSRFEPCGLNQMYSLRYGTVPIVRATGGLDDTIDGETGFKFWGYEPRDFLAAIRLALQEFRHAPDAWRLRMLTGMGRDFSWDASARTYSRLYDQLW